MELLLLCAIAFAAGQQSEQLAVGMTPGDRAVAKEQSRHEKALRKIAEKHGTLPPQPMPLPGASPWPAAPVEPAVTVPEAFRAGYRGHTPIERVATPLGRRAGGWTARGWGWVKDTGRGAVREYRRRRTAQGHEDPAPVLAPVAAPPAPVDPPTVHEKPERNPVANPRLCPLCGELACRDLNVLDYAADPITHTCENCGAGLVRGNDGWWQHQTGQPPQDPTPATTEPQRAMVCPECGETAVNRPPTSWTPAWGPPPAWSHEDGEPLCPVVGDRGYEPAKPAPGRDESSSSDDVEPPDAAGTKEPAVPEEPAAEPASGKSEESAPEEAPEKTPETAGEEERPASPDSGEASTGNGVGRMAAEVTYESVMDESDELSLMCEDDVQVYGRIEQRCEREIGRADALIADARNAGFGESVIGWISQALEKYQGIHSALDELRANTVAQGEAVVKAKASLEAGQGLYVDIAKDMEDVAERDSYISDAVDSEDATAGSETYETQGA